MTTIERESAFYKELPNLYGKRIRASVRPMLLCGITKESVLYNIKCKSVHCITNAVREGFSVITTNIDPDYPFANMFELALIEKSLNVASELIHLGTEIKPEYNEVLLKMFPPSFNEMYNDDWFHVVSTLLEIATPKVITDILKYIKYKCVNKRFFSEQYHTSRICLRVLDVMLEKTDSVHRDTDIFHSIWEKTPESIDSLVKYLPYSTLVKFDGHDDKKKDRMINDPNSAHYILEMGWLDLYKEHVKKFNTPLPLISHSYPSEVLFELYSNIGKVEFTKFLDTWSSTTKSTQFVLGTMKNIPFEMTVKVASELLKTNYRDRVVTALIVPLKNKEITLDTL